MGSGEVAIGLVAIAIQFLPLLAVMFVFAAIFQLRRHAASLEQRVRELEVRLSTVPS